MNCIFFVVIAYDLRSQFLLYSPLSGKEPRLERFFFGISCVSCCDLFSKRPGKEHSVSQEEEFAVLRPQCQVHFVTCLGEFVGCSSGDPNGGLQLFPPKKWR